MLRFTSYCFSLCFKWICRSNLCKCGVIKALVSSSCSNAVCTLATDMAFHVQPCSDNHAVVCRMCSASYILLKVVMFMRFRYVSSCF